MSTMDVKLLIIIIIMIEAMAVSCTFKTLKIRFHLLKRNFIPTKHSRLYGNTSNCILKHIKLIHSVTIIYVLPVTVSTRATTL